MPIVTISRMHGSQGDALARELARRLGYRLVDRTELVRLAGGYGGGDELERSPEIRERSPSFWERLNEERRRYATVLKSVVVHLAEQDEQVIVGLGAGQLLRGLSHVLRVQVVAPLETRLERVMLGGDDERPGPLTRDQARDLLRTRDRDAAGYMRYLFNIDWLDSARWDLVINTGRFSVHQAVEAIASVLEAGAVTSAAAESDRLHDMTLAARVEMALLNHASVWVNGLKVASRAGILRIEGEVIGEDDREVAEQVVRSIEGVREVENDLRLQPPPLTGM